MKIAMIGQKTIPFVRIGGGIEKHVEELSIRLVKQSHQVWVYSRNWHTKRGNHQERYKGVEIIYLPSIPTKNLGTISHVLLSTLHVLFKKVDIIHFHGVGPSTLAWIPRLFKPRVKVVVTFHSIDRFHKKWGRFARAYLSWGEWTACHFPHRTIAVSRSIQQYCREKFGKKISYIPNGVDLKDDIKPEDDKLKKFGLKKNQYILTVARLIKHKGIHHLIKAYIRLEKRYGDEDKNWPGGKKMKLAIVGAPSFTDDYLQYLKKLAAESENILFVGFQTGKTLAQLFVNAYLYVHPSESEGLALSILEAMSYGKCVLVSNIAENLEAVGDTGRVFRSKNIKNLEQSLDQILRSKKEINRCGRETRAFVRKNFNWDDIVKQTEELYKKPFHATSRANNKIRLPRNPGIFL